MSAFGKDGGKDAEGADRVVIGSFQARLQLTQTRELLMSGHIYSDDDPKDVNLRLDAFQDALDRQGVRCDIVNKEAQLVAQREGLRDLEFRIKELEMAAASKGRDNGLGHKGKGLTSQDNLNLKNYHANIRQIKHNIESLEAAVRAAKAKLAIE